ncbi:alpha/beta hydrolase [Brucepastera parasyntrophica]|uniref:alpha/beta hydrolase n=1 Tax=Brucepastera parasyntrophica TaxID=2880008 RepID=UPI0034E2D4F0
MSGFAHFFHDEFGFNVLMPDARGHGASEGTYIGFGWPERLDYLEWIDWAINKNGHETQIALFGISMGGATVMMTSGENLPENVKVAIEDCGYTSAYEELLYQFNRIFPGNNPSVIEKTSQLTKKRVGYTFEEASAFNQVRKSKTPTLFIHGEADSFVPFEMVYKVHDACASEKALYTVPDAGHSKSFDLNPDEYKRQVRTFMGKHMTIPG